ncbi:MAG TPA: hypothetical protein VHA56_02290 [Mucilaginibacter sp.]|nr:hypothetical protein [Mucilaginibacter sp.]
MKPFISTAVYGVLNYIVALTMIASPWLFGVVHVSNAAIFLPMYFGWLQLIMAIFANNEAGFLKQFPMTIHSVIDVVMGFVIMVSPWLYVYSPKLWPQVILGAVLFLMGIFNKKSPFTTRTRHNHSVGFLTSTDSN